MNLKIDDLEKKSNKNLKTDQSIVSKSAANSLRQSELSVANISVESKNLILQSMKDALLYMIQHKETADASQKSDKKGVPHAYERII